MQLYPFKYFWMWSLAHRCVKVWIHNMVLFLNWYKFLYYVNLLFYMGRAPLCTRIWKKVLGKVTEYLDILRLKKKRNLQTIVPRGQLSDKENGKIEALMGDKRSEKFVFITPGYCLPYSRQSCNSWVVRVLHLTVPGLDFSWHIIILQISTWTEGRVIRGLFCCCLTLEWGGLLAYIIW